MIPYLTKVSVILHCNICQLICKCATNIWSFPKVDTQINRVGMNSDEKVS